MKNDKKIVIKTGTLALIFLIAITGFIAFFRYTSYGRRALLPISVKIFAGNLIYKELRISTHYRGNARKICDAITQKDDELLQNLLNKPFNVNHKYKHNATLLLFALLEENEYAFRLLLERGADPNIQSKQNLFYFDSKGDKKVCRLGDSVTSLSAATQTYPSSYLKMVLQNKGDPNLINPHTGLTPLYDLTIHTSVTEWDKDAKRIRRVGEPENQVEKFRDLIEAGADFEYRPSNQPKLLFLTIELRRPQYTLLLLENGADYCDPLSRNDCLTELLSVGLMDQPGYAELKEWLEKNSFNLDVLKSRYNKDDVTSLPFNKRPWLPAQNISKSAGASFRDLTINANPVN